MSLNAATIEILLAKGLTGDDLLAVARAMEVRRDPTAAERMARHRSKKDATRNVTCNPPNDSILTPEELPQEAKASLPQGAKTKRDAVAWPCPANVEPAHWRDFQVNRRRKRCAWTQTALDGVLTDIEKYSDDDWPPGRLVKRSAEKGWASICDPRTPLNGSQNGQPRQPANGLRGHRPDPALDLYRAAVAAEERENREAHIGIGLEIPAIGSSGP